MWFTFEINYTPVVKELSVADSVMVFASVWRLFGGTTGCQVFWYVTSICFGPFIDS